MKKKFLKILAISSLMLTAGGVIASNYMDNRSDVQMAQAANPVVEHTFNFDDAAKNDADWQIETGHANNKAGFAAKDYNNAVNANGVNFYTVKVGQSNTDIILTSKNSFDSITGISFKGGSSDKNKVYFRMEISSTSTFDNPVSLVEKTSFYNLGATSNKQLMACSATVSQNTGGYIRFIISASSSGKYVYMDDLVISTQSSKQLQSLSITSDAPETGLYFGEKANLSVTGTFDDNSQEAVMPENACWTSDHPELVSVNNNVVEVIKTPEADTTVTLTLNYDGQTQTTAILVKTDSLNAIAVSSAKVDVYYEETANLTVTGTFVSGKSADVTETITEWVVSDPALVAVNNGVVSVLVNPEVDTPVTVTAKSGALENSVALNIKRNVANSIALDVSTSTLKVGEAKELKVTATKTNGATSAVSAELVTWESSNPAVVSVEKGLVKALAKSEEPVTITATYEGYTATCTIDVISATLKFDASASANWTPADPATNPVENNVYNHDGYAIEFNKNSNGKSQVQTITFTPEKNGTITVSYDETSKSKERQLHLIESDVVVDSYVPSSGTSGLTAEFIVEANKTYKIVNVERSDKTTVGMINLSKLDFVEASVSCGYQMTNENVDTQTKAMRLVGRFDGYLTERIEFVGFELKNTSTEQIVKRYTNSLMTTIDVNGEQVAASTYNADYIFAFIIEDVSADTIGVFSFRSYVQLKDGTTIYSSVEYMTATY